MRSRRRKRIAKNVAKKVVYRMQGIKEDGDVRKTSKKTMILILEDHVEDEGADEEDHAHARDAAVPSSLAPAGFPPCSRVPEVQRHTSKRNQRLGWTTPERLRKRRKP